MSSFHLVNVWTDAEPGPGGFVPVTDSLLWLPDDFRPGHAAPAFVLVHGWGDYPQNKAAIEVGPQLADSGFACLSVCLRRRGMEGQLNGMPDDDLRDIKLAIDYLHTNGCRRIILLGQQLGGHSALRYVVKHRDRRVSGLAWVDPVPAPSDWLQAHVAPADYQAALAQAGLAARQGAGMDFRIDLLPESGPTVTQNALAFLAWWAPAAAMSLERNLADLQTPLRIFSDGKTSVPDALAGCDVSNNSVAALIGWADEHGACVATPVTPELVQVSVADQQLDGLFWGPATGASTRNVMVLVPGLTSSAFSPLLQQMAPVLAQKSMAVLAVGLRRSGWAGHESSVLENDADDIDAWVTWLIGQGFDRITLAGASIGSISVGRYLSVRPNKHLVALAHLMPTAECSDWFKAAAGEGAYAQAVAQAEQAIAQGRGETELIDIDVRQPPPSRQAARFRWTQRATSWLSWWGPAADSSNLKHIANARVPLMLLSGTADSYNDKARFSALKAAAVNAPSVAEIWYPDVDHGLAGVERTVALDLLAWLENVDVL